VLLRFVVKRILLAIPLLIGVTLVTFIVSHLVPADPLTAVLPERA
jgi:peptide/nickel transport system permease protein